MRNSENRRNVDRVSRTLDGTPFGYMDGVLVPGSIVSGIYVAAHHYSGGYAWWNRELRRRARAVA